MTVPQCEVILGIRECGDHTKIHGRLSYAGYSRNRKLYSPAEIAAGDGLTVDVILNHAGTTAISGVPESLLPESYRLRLENGEWITLGKAKLRYDEFDMALYYTGIITDPFYRQKKILKQVAVSHGTIHDADLEHDCDVLGCYKKVTGVEFTEMSIVFNPGFPFQSISAENSSFSVQTESKNQMKTTSKPKSTEASDCNCGKGNENQLEDTSIQADGTPQVNGQCGEGMVWDEKAQQCVAADSQAPIEPGVEAEDNDDDNKDADKKDKSDEVDQALENLKETIKRSITEDITIEDKIQVDEEIKTDISSEGYKGPNADAKSRQKAQEAYVKGLEQRDAKRQAKSLEVNQQLLNVVNTMMKKSHENAQPLAMMGDKSFQNGSKVTGMEAVEQTVQSWMQKIVSGESVMPTKSWKIGNEHVSRYINRFFKEYDKYGNENHVAYAQKMKSIGTEATNINMIGGDSDNFMRTMSELVYVDPEGNIVTPIEQFCEVKTLSAGQKEALFFDINKPKFAPTDESGKNAGGSGYALKPTDVTIHTSGGKITPEGGLVRLGYTDLEEIPIDIPRKINVGFAMEAEHSKNHEALVNAYNDDTAYDSDSDKRRPKGGGAKHVEDVKGNTHWINGNNGAQISKSDGDAAGDIPGVLSFKGILDARTIIKETGITQKPILYTTPKGVKDVILDKDHISSYLQRSVPEVITEAELEKIAGVNLIETDTLAPGAGKDSPVVRSVMFVPQVAFGMTKGRDLMIKAEDVARDQSIYMSASQKVGVFVKKVELTCRISHR